MPSSGCPSFTSIASNANGFVYGNAISGSPYTTGAAMNAGSGTPYSNPTTGDQLGRIDIAVAPSNPQVIYAQVQSIAPNGGQCGNTNGCQLGIWQTSRRRDIVDVHEGLPGPGPGRLRNRPHEELVRPRGSPSTQTMQTASSSTRLDVWFGTRTGFVAHGPDVRLQREGGNVVHVDQHALAFVPGSSSILLIGSDGGAFSTSNADIAGTGTPTFVNMKDGLNTIEFYSGDISGNFATSPNPPAAGGAQDNAPSVVGFSGYPAAPAQWQMTVGGDGFSPGSTRSKRGRARATSSATTAAACRAASRTASSAGAATRASPAAGAATRGRSLALDLFHGGVPGGDDCAPAGTPGGCGHLVDGTTRVWESIKGGDAAWPEVGTSRTTRPLRT